MKPVLAFAIACLLCACAPQSKAPNVNLGGYPPAFRAGYIDGCESAQRITETVRDEQRFKTDSMYASGWRDGFDICGKRTK